MLQGVSRAQRQKVARPRAGFDGMNDKKQDLLLRFRVCLDFLGQAIGEKREDLAQIFIALKRLTGLMAQAYGFLVSSAVDGNPGASARRKPGFDSSLAAANIGRGEGPYIEFVDLTNSFAQEHGLSFDRVQAAQQRVAATQAGRVKGSDRNTKCPDCGRKTNKPGVEHAQGCSNA